MSRSSWKNLVILNENLSDLLKNEKKKIVITKRNFIISEKFLDKKVTIYNGRLFNNVFIDSLKLGYKFGEFSFTRKYPKHKIKKKK